MIYNFFLLNGLKKEVSTHVSDKIPVNNLKLDNLIYIYKL